jgi:hypothetical protein
MTCLCVEHACALANAAVVEQEVDGAKVLHRVLGLAGQRVDVSEIQRQDVRLEVIAARLDACSRLCV